MDEGVSVWVRLTCAAELVCFSSVLDVTGSLGAAEQFQVTSCTLKDLSRVFYFLRLLSVTQVSLMSMEFVVRIQAKFGKGKVDASTHPCDPQTWK